jgi:DNA-binding transcriptional regulator YhcF (GntR family)
MDVKVRIDRSLPVSIHDQLTGQIKYAITTGQLKPGEPLPSAGRLAEELGVSPATVWQVYRDLRREGFLRAKAGSGTFVADVMTHEAINMSRRSGRLWEIMDAAIREARSEGFADAEIGRTVFARLATVVQPQQEIALGLIGTAKPATIFYAEDIAKILQDVPVRVRVFTINEFYDDPRGVRDQLRTVKLILTPANLSPEVKRFLQDEDVPIVQLSFTISDITRETLVRLPRVQPVGIVATFPEFLLTLIETVQLYYPLDEKPLCSIVTDEERTRDVVSRVKLVIYATGSEIVLEWLPPNVQTVEYLHKPDPTMVEMIRTLLA